LRGYIEEVARRESIQADLLEAVIFSESRFRPCAVSSKGAVGLMQLMPGTASDLGVEDTTDPAENIAAGARFLKTLLRRYGGNLPLALAAYRLPRRTQSRGRPSRNPADPRDAEVRVGDPLDSGARRDASRRHRLAVSRSGTHGTPSCAILKRDRRPPMPQPANTAPDQQARAGLAEARLITVPHFRDARGSLAVIERAEMPFPAKRFYYLFNVPSNSRRAGHAHFSEQELMVALQGSFTVTTDNGGGKTEFLLDRPDIALHVPPMVWHELHGFAPGSVCAVLSSAEYDEQEYCRDYEVFLQARRAQ
jgi:hypothetical protein